MANLTEKSQEIWKKIKNQPKDIWFFYLFLLTFTLGVRKVILYFPLKGTFNEYTGAYVYASDIFLCLAILGWIITILYNKILLSSSGSDGVYEVIHRIKDAEGVDNLATQKLSTEKLGYFKAFSPKMFHVEHFQAIIKKCSTWNIFCSSSVFLIPLLLVIWSFVSVFWSENRVISIYRSVKFLELYLLFIYVSIRFVPHCLNYFDNCSTWNNLQSENVENVPRGTFSSKADGSDSKLFHVEHFDCVLLETAQYFSAILLGLVLIMLFDHYLWDIWQGQILFWLVCGVLVGISFGKRHNLDNCSTWNNSVVNNSEIVPRGTINVFGSFCSIIVLIGIAQSLIGIAQFIIQHSLGLFWLKESLIDPSIAGVAEIIVNNQPLMRAYGLLPHPNILGGFLFFSIMVTMMYIKLFHVEHFKEQHNANCSTWNNFWKVWKNVPRGTIGLNFINLILIIQVIGIIFSFSKSAILALLVALVYINVPRGTICDQKILKMFHVEHFRLLFGLVLVLLTGLLFLRVEFYALFVKSLEERGLYLSISQRIISESPIIGVGSGQFIFEAVRLFPNLEIWQYQPVHNVFLLIWSEWGIVGLVLFILFLWKLFHTNVPRGTI